MANIGFIGLGHMGLPMVINLLKAQHSLRVFDIQPQAVQAAVAKGATAVTHIAELAQHCDVVFTMLQTDAQVAATCLGEQGLFANAHKELLYIDCSSIDVAKCRQIHQHARDAGVTMLDAPVSGGVAGAEAATLTIMVGGAAEDFAQAQPLLAQLGKVVIHAGDDGNGQVAKICNNMILGISMIAISEAYTLAEKLGLKTETFHQISNQASGQCWAMSNYSPVPGILPHSPASNGYQPGFSAQMMLKDLNLSQSAAEYANVTTQLGALATNIYQQFNQDSKSLFKV